MGKKRKRPAEAIFDDEKELELEREGGADTPLDSGAASVSEMTGLVPSGGDMTGDGYESQKDLFPFSLTDTLPR